MSDFVEKICFAVVKIALTCMVSALAVITVRVAIAVVMHGIPAP